jgi:tetratricopeptide (TPR) repeat protein
MFLSNLGTALRTKSEQSGTVKDLDRAIETLESAVKQTPEDHQSRSTYLSNLGTALQQRYERRGSIDDFENAIKVYTGAVGLRTCSPSSRITPARQGAHLLYPSDITRAAQFLKSAVELLPQVSPRTLKRHDQQFALSKFSGLASDAAALSLRSENDVEEALRLLELGRGVMASLLMDTRTDITDLAEHNSELAKKFQILQDKLDPGPPVASPEFLEDQLSPNATKGYVVAVEDFQNLLESIRALKGFENFLRSPSQAELTSIPPGNFIVVLNVCSYGSDAFLMSSERAWSIRLPSIDAMTLQKKAMAVREGIKSLKLLNYPEVRNILNETMKWLWDVAIGRVLQELNIIHTPLDGNWPHVWWVGSGWLSILPIHAAGYHDGSSNNIIDRVISSYTPTIRSLFYARKTVESQSLMSPTSKALLVGVPKATGLKSLPFVEKEVEQVATLLSRNIRVIEMLNATKYEVTSNLPDSKIVHFACHGQAAYPDPSKSNLGLTDWKTEPLTISDIMLMKLQSAQLIYLSTCHAANNRSHDLLDESIHIASAFQLAGFPRVVATLWQVGDESSASVAREFYEGLLNQSSVEVGRTALSLHNAIRKLRDQTQLTQSFSKKSDHDPLVWAAYVHLGV